MAVPRRGAAGLFALVLAVYLATASGHINSIDIQQELLVSQSMVDRGAFNIPFLPNRAWDLANMGLGGQVFAPHGLGMSVLLAPVALVGEVVGARPGFAALGVATGFFPLAASVVIALVAALTVLVVFMFGCRLGAGVRPSAAAALLFALASLEWPYAHDTFDAGATGLFVVLGAYGAYRYVSGSRPWLAGSGAAFGFAALVHAEVVLLFPFALGLVFAGCRRRHEPLRRLTEWLVPAGAFLVLMGWFNWVRYGSFFNDGHSSDPSTKLTTPLLTGVHGLLASPGKSLFLFSPVLLLGLWGLPRLTRRYRALGVAVIGMLVVFVLFHAKLGNWAGDWAWGPRFLVPVTGLLMLPAVPVLARWSSMRSVARLAVVAVSAAGAGAAILGVATDYEAVMQVRPSYTTASPYWSVQGSQMVLAARALDRSVNGLDPYPEPGAPPGGKGTPPLDLWWVGYLARGYHGAAALWAVGCLSAVAAAGALLLWRDPAIRAGGSGGTAAGDDPHPGGHRAEAVVVDDPVDLH